MRMRMRIVERVRRIMKHKQEISDTIGTGNRRQSGQISFTISQKLIYAHEKRRNEPRKTPISPKLNGMPFRTRKNGVKNSSRSLLKAHFLPDETKALF